MIESAGLSGCDLENGKQPLSHDRGGTWIRTAPVKKYGFFQTVKVRGAVRTTSQVLPDFPASRGEQLGIELILNMPRHLAAQFTVCVDSLHNRLRFLQGISKTIFDDARRRATHETQSLRGAKRRSNLSVNRLFRSLNPARMRNPRAGLRKRRSQ
jgi:hypothetical protein